MLPPLLSQAGKVYTDMNSKYSIDFGSYFDKAPVVEEQPKQTGIVAPRTKDIKAPTDDGYKPDAFVSDYMKILAEYAGGEDKARELLGRTASTYDPMATLDKFGEPFDMAQAAQDDAFKWSAARDAAGITQSLPTPGFEMRMGEAGVMPGVSGVDTAELPARVAPVGREDMLKGAGLASPMGGSNRGSVRPAAEATSDIGASVEAAVAEALGGTEEDTTGEGLMTRPKARPTGLSSPVEKERIKAVQSIIGTKADGAFGRGSKEKLKAWQYVHDVPVTGELDTPTMAALKDNDTYDPRTIKKDNFIQTPTFDLLKGVEGFEEDAYLGKISHKFKSGLTVGAGIDFGQHTKQALLDKGLPASLVDKADTAGWVGLNPDTIVDPNTGLPASQGSGTKAQRRARGKALLEAKMTEQKRAGTFPEFSYEELAASTPIMYKPYSDAAKRDYDAVEGEGSFDALSEGTKSVLATEKYHRGEGYDISGMFDGARADDPLLTANGIRLEGRKNNMKAWLRKVGLDK